MRNFASRSEDRLPLPPMSQTLKRFLPYLWPRGRTDLKIRICLSLLFVLVSKAIILSMPFAYKNAIDQMNIGGSDALTLALAMVVAYGAARFGSVLFDQLRNVAFEKVGQTATQNLAMHVFERLHTLSMRFHLSRRTGEVTKVIERGTKSIDTMLYFMLFNIAPTAIELMAVLIIFWINFGFSLVVATLVMVAVYIVFTRIVTDWRNHLRDEMNNLDSSALARAVDSLLNFETVKYFSAEAREAERYGAATRSYAAAAVKSNNSLAGLNAGQAFITNLMMLGAMAFTVWGWSAGRFTVGDLVLVNTLLMQLFRPLDLLGMVYRTIRQGMVDMHAMFDLIDTKAEIQDVANAPSLRVNSPRVRFDNVHFGYDPDRKILNGISFTAEAGSTLAIVGPSGAGKSTIARLLFRFYDPQAGRICIDGQDIATVTQASLRQSIGIVPQDTVLFNDSIGYNIGYGRDGARDDDIAQAAHGAAIGDFIESLPDGYQTQVGERGLKLSGGEKQRVAIARTLLKNPPILLFDEATSALDSGTESAILGTMRRISQDRTTLIIAHRLSTVTHADLIIVLDKGQIAEQGSHQYLLEQNGLYAAMWQRQAQKQDNRDQYSATDASPNAERVS